MGRVTMLGSRILGVGVVLVVVTFAVARLGVGRHDGRIEDVGRPIGLALIDAAQAGCGGVPTIRWAGGTWRCTFSDDFDGTRPDGTGLDGTKWAVTQTGHTGFRFGGECYVDDPANVSVRAGRLDLTVRSVGEPFTCRSAVDAYRTRYTGAMITSAKRFDQAYGRFEVRARFLTPGTAGLHSAIWLWPSARTYGAWPRSGEIDIAEYYTRHPDRVIPYVHYASARPDPTATNDRCRVKTPDQFHTYAAEWTPDAITITFDGLACTSTRWDQPGPRQKPAPFDRPFHLNLTQALGIGQNAFDPERTRLPATMQVDHVHVWGSSDIGRTR
jgi:beta-glucanase (GH16 family)